MEKKTQKNFIGCALLLCAFVLWTLVVLFVDVKLTGPYDSKVGLATANSFFHKLTGVNMALYDATDLLGIVPIAFVFGFGVLGLCQLIKRKNIKKVDFDLLALAGFYVIVAAVFVFFEIFVVNYRPILIDGALEASYPSSTTLLVMCIMPTSAIQLEKRIKSKKLKANLNTIIYLFAAFMVLARLVSGVHWLSDIVGGALLSLFLVFTYKEIIK